MTMFHTPQAEALLEAQRQYENYRNQANAAAQQAAPMPINNIFPAPAPEPIPESEEERKERMWRAVTDFARST